MQDDLLTRLRDVITTHHFWNYTDKIVMAVSGGRDSMVMLDLFVRLALNPSLSLIIAHYDHASRTGSENDKCFVENYCRSRNLVFISERSTGIAKGISREAAWRKQRYGFLQAVSQKNLACGICTAHTADDQAETLLLRLIRGCGPRGLLGIRQKTATHLIRPMLAFTRQEITRYAATFQIPFRDDPSNEDIGFPRNFIRKNLIPEIASLNPNYQHSIMNLSQLLEEDDQLLSHLAVSELQKWGWSGKIPFTMSLVDVQKIPLALVRRIALFLYSHFDPDNQTHVTSLKINAITACLTGSRNTAVLPFSHQIKTFKKKLILFQIPDAAFSDHQKPILSDDMIVFGGFTITSSLVARNDFSDCSLTGEKVFNCNTSGLNVRFGKPGDRIACQHPERVISLREYFNRQGILPELRCTYPVIASESGTVFAVLGVNEARVILFMDDDFVIRITWYNLT